MAVLSGIATPLPSAAVRPQELQPEGTESPQAQTVPNTLSELKRT